MRGLPPGDYFAIAVPYVWQGEWLDLEFFDKLDSAATRLQLTAGTRTPAGSKYQGGRAARQPVAGRDPLPASGSAVATQIRRPVLVVVVVVTGPPTWCAGAQPKYAATIARSACSQMSCPYSGIRPKVVLSTGISPMIVRTP